MGMNKEDQALMRRLHDKYAKLGERQQEDDCNDVQPRASSDTDANRLRGSAPDLDVRACVACHGSGLRTEEYNHRVLQHTCVDCMGRGARVFKDGKEITQPSTNAAPESASADLAVHPKHDSDPRASNIQTDIRRMQQSITRYQQEKEALQDPSGASCPEEQKLRQGVIEQLDKQIDRINYFKGKKERQLRQLQTADTSTNSSSGAQH